MIPRGLIIIINFFLIIVKYMNVLILFENIFQVGIYLLYQKIILINN